MISRRSWSFVFRPEGTMISDSFPFRALGVECSDHVYGADVPDMEDMINPGSIV